MKNLIRSIAIPALVAAAAAGTANAHQFRYYYGTPISWPNKYCVMRLSAISFASITVRDAMREAAVLWDKGPSNFDFYVATNDTNINYGNGQSESWFTSDQYYLNGAPAVALGYFSGSEITESDVLFNSTMTWTFGNTKTMATAYFGPGVHFKSTAIHELGHTLGLVHEADTYNVMGDSHRHLNANGSTCQAYPGEDASDGAVDLYGLDPSRSEDVGVVHWRRTGQSGEYSTHDKVRVFLRNGSVATRVGVNGEWGYRVPAGETIQVEFALENNGSTAQQPRVRYYGSTNDFISINDRVLATSRPIVSRNAVYMRRQTVRVPSNLISGQNYFIGVYIDYDNAIAESNELNNRTYIGLRIQ